MNCVKAIIVSGPTEMTMCSNIPGSVDFVVQSLDEALKRFMPDGTEDEPAIVEEQKPTVEENKETKSPTEGKFTISAVLLFISPQSQTSFFKLSKWLNLHWIFQHPELGLFTK